MSYDAYDDDDTRDDDNDTSRDDSDEDSSKGSWIEGAGDIFRAVIDPTPISAIQSGLKWAGRIR